MSKRASEQKGALALLLTCSSALLLACFLARQGRAQDMPFGEPREAEIRRLFAEASLAGAEDAEKAAAAKKRLTELVGDALPFLVSSLDTKNPRELATIEAVVCAAGASAVEPLVAQLDSSNENASAQAVRLLGALGSAAARAVERLCGLVTGGRTWLARANAANSLGRIADARANDALLTALFDQSEPVRKEAAVALGKLKQPSAVQPLIKALDDRFFSVRYAAADALAAIGGDASAELAKRLDPFTSQNTDTRREFSDVAAALAVQTLGRLKDLKTLNLLKKLLSAPDWGLRASAAEALGAAGGGQAAQATRQALQKALVTEKHYLVRRNIEDALARLQE